MYKIFWRPKGGGGGSSEPAPIPPTSANRNIFFCGIQMSPGVSNTYIWTAKNWMQYSTSHVWLCSYLKWQSQSIKFPNISLGGEGGGGVLPQTLPVLHAYACIPCTSDTNITLILKILATGLGYKPKLVTRVRISLKNYQEHPQHLQSHKTMAVNNAQCNYLWVIALLHSFSTLTHYCIGRML